MRSTGARVFRAAALAVAAVAIAPTAAEACAVCFGEAEGPMIDGARMGVWMLFGLTLLVQGAFVAFFVTLYRRSRGPGRRETATKSLPVVGSQGEVSRP